MTITTYADYKAKIEAAQYKYPFMISSTTTVANKLMSTWTAAPDAGATPSTAAACSRSTAGNKLIGMNGTVTNPLYIAQIEAGTGTSSIFSYWLCDRLSHQGGLAGNISGSEQTTNLPTAALPRYTSGVGVFIGLEIYTVIGTGTSVATVRYTNSGGTGSRTTKGVDIGATGNREAGRFIICPLQDDDVGVDSVEGVTLTGSTATAGNFGVTLFRPLCMVPTLALQNQMLNGGYRDMMTSSGGGALVEIEDDACIFALIMTPATGHTLQGTITLIEG